MCACACVGLSDQEDWLELNDRELKAIPPGVKPVLGQAAGKAPDPVGGPHLQLTVVPDAAGEARGPNIPILVKPPVKVSCICTSLFCKHQLKLR